MTVTVYAVPRDSADDMTEGRGLPVLEDVSEDAADDYVLRNESPDNPDRYEIREAR